MKIKRKEKEAQKSLSHLEHFKAEVLEEKLRALKRKKRPS